jgi:hypothetical protein
MYPWIVNLKNGIAVIIDEAGRLPYQAFPVALRALQPTANYCSRSGDQVRN